MKKLSLIKELYENGLIYIKELLEDNGNLISYETLTQNFENDMSPYSYVCLKHAIPRGWRKLLQGNITINVNPKQETVFIKIKK